MCLFINKSISCLHHERLTKMLVEMFKSGAIDSRPSGKCGILFVGAGHAPSPTIRMNVGWTLRR